MGGRRAGGGLRNGDGQKGGLKEALEVELVGEIEALVGPGAVDALDFEAVETALRTKVLAATARLLERQLNADHSDGQDATRKCRDCSSPAAFAGRRRKEFTCVLGTLELERAYYHCSGCHRGFFPRDRALGLAGSSLSAGVIRMVGAVGSRMSFEEGSEVLAELAGLEINAKQVERTAERLGEEISRDERESVEPPLPAEIPSTVYLGMDGTGIPMRVDELAGRAGKQPDGSAKTREVKLCTVWSAEGRDAEGLPTRDEDSTTYSAAIESAACRDVDERPSEFAERVWREATRRGFDRAQRRVAIGDGAPWIWNLIEEWFPDAIQIVDRYHAKEHLSQVAKAIYGPTSDLATQWAKDRGAELDLGALDAIVKSLAPHVTAVPEARRCRDYIEKNSHRMRYPEFHAQGLCSSSGVVEAGCRVAIGQRLKQSGMFWSVRGANAIIALRCSRLSRRFEDFWERRAARCRAA